MSSTSDAVHALTERSAERARARLDARNRLLGEFPEGEARILLGKLESAPGFFCDDVLLEELYWFRVFVLLRHIVETPGGRIITEFVDPVPWAGPYGGIAAASGHHFRDARWLDDPGVLHEYAQYWLTGQGQQYAYSSWLPASIRDAAQVTGVDSWTGSIPSLVDHWHHWAETHSDASGLYAQSADRDGMEIGGSWVIGYRPTVQSYQAGSAGAIAELARVLGDISLSQEMTIQRDRLKTALQGHMWSDRLQFFVPVSTETLDQSECRELIGYIPWYFDLAEAHHAGAWSQLISPGGFQGDAGLTTLERRSPAFLSPDPHECRWNGPSWPFATSQTLTALSNAIRNEVSGDVSAEHWRHLLHQYSAAQHLGSGATAVPWIDESMHPDSGEWMTRAELKSAGDVHWDRGRDYLHSSYLDLIIRDLMGVQPQLDGSLIIAPLLSNDTRAALTNVHIQGHVWDFSWNPHDRSGYQVWRDRVEVYSSSGIPRRITIHDAQS